MIWIKLKYRLCKILAYRSVFDFSKLRLTGYIFKDLEPQMLCILRISEIQSHFHFIVEKNSINKKTT
ncbi:hypothetical protein CR511_19200 [Pseudomonas putida]|nr:hypothetical protein CR511_19200 [Pseudomonas putida]